MRQITASGSGILSGYPRTAPLLDGSNAEGAWRVAEDLRATVEAIRPPNCPCPLTISIGIATTSDGRNPKVFDQMLSSADRLLYQAKKQGRNRVMPRAA